MRTATLSHAATVSMCAQTDSDDADDQYPDEDVDTESYSGSNSGEGDGEEDGEEATASPAETVSRSA